MIGFFNHFIHQNYAFLPFSLFFEAMLHVGDIKNFARLDMTEKKLKVQFLLSLLLATLIFFWPPIDTLGTFKPPLKKIFLFY